MDNSTKYVKNQKVPLGLLAGTRAQSWAEILCCGVHNWDVYCMVRSNWECCTKRCAGHCEG